MDATPKKANVRFLAGVIDNRKSRTEKPSRITVVIILLNHINDENAISTERTFNVIPRLSFADTNIIVLPNRALPIYPPIVMSHPLPPIVVVTPLPSTLTHSDSTSPPLSLQNMACPNSCRNVHNISTGNIKLDIEL